MDKICNIIAKDIASKFLGDLDLEVGEGVLRGTNIVALNDKHVVTIGLYPKGEDGEIEEQPVGTWTITCERQD